MVKFSLGWLILTRQKHSFCLSAETTIRLRPSRRIRWALLSSKGVLQIGVVGQFDVEAALRRHLAR